MNSGLMIQDGVTTVLPGVRTLRAIGGQRKKWSDVESERHANRLNYEIHMKYSESVDYQDYVVMKVQGDFASAEKSLHRCIQSGVGVEKCHVADLLQRMGELRFLQNDCEEALRYFEQAEQADPDSLLAAYYYARFLGTSIGDVQAALVKCDSIIAKVREGSFEKTDDDFGGDEYLRKALELKDQLTSSNSSGAE